jgi:hypothetical protein
MNRAVEPLLTKVVAPERLTPLFLLAMHGYFENRLELGRVDKAEQPFLIGNFMPALLDSAALMLLDKPVAGVLDATGAKLIETMVFNLLRARYGIEYRTLMAISTWRDSMRTYANIIKRLESTVQKQGIIPVEGTRDQTMKLVNLPATTFDTIASNFPDLIEIVTDFKRAKIGSVRFRLHPLESSILDWLTTSTDTITSDNQVLHRLSASYIVAEAKRQGYKSAEVEQIIIVMNERELVYQDQYRFVVERPSITVSVEEVAIQVELLIAQLELVQNTFPEATELRTVNEDANALNQMLRQMQGQRKPPDPKTLALIDTRTRSNLKLLAEALHSRLEALKVQVNRIVKRYYTLNAPSVETLHVIETESPYSELLEQACNALSDTCSQVAITVREYQDRSDIIAQRLNIGNYPQDALPEIVADVHVLDEQFDQMAADLTSLSTLVSAYSVWPRIVLLRKTLSEQIIQLGREGNNMSNRLEQLDREIAASFARDWQAGLSQGDTYERRLNSLLEVVDEIEKRASRQFQQLQSAFLSCLRSVNCPEEKLWSPIVFSQAEIQRVYEQLYSYAGRATIGAVDHAENMIQRLCSELRQMSASPDRELIADRIKVLLGELVKLTTDLPYTSANNPQTVREFDGSQGVFLQTIDALQNIWGTIDTYRNLVIELNVDAPQIHLAPLEEEIASHLRSDALTDLGIVWGYLESLSADAVWSALRTLWEKGVIQIGIRKMT